MLTNPYGSTNCIRFEGMISARRAPLCIYFSCLPAVPEAPVYASDCKDNDFFNYFSGKF